MRKMSLGRLIIMALLALVAIYFFTRFLGSDSGINDTDYNSAGVDNLLDLQVMSMEIFQIRLWIVAVML
jgi:hypothetical protein